MVDFNSVYDVTKTLDILYVEDDKEFQENTTEVLNMLFSKVDIASNGKDGIDSYLSYFETNNKYYDIVITDVNMPYINGIELTKLIYKENKSQPIIVVSAYNDSENLLEFVNIGIKQFLIKPLDSNKILDILFEVANEIIDTKVIVIDTYVEKLNNNYYWNYEQKQLYCDNHNIILSYKELLLMILFMKNKNKTSIYNEIFTELWGDDAYKIMPSQIKPIISNLRKKLPHQKILNISKVGYRLEF
jgi:DNA-binding response OmpR family regulator